MYAVLIQVNTHAHTHTEAKLQNPLKSHYPAYNCLSHWYRELKRLDFVLFLLFWWFIMFDHKLLYFNLNQLFSNFSVMSIFRSRKHLMTSRHMGSVAVECWKANFIAILLWEWKNERHISFKFIQILHVSFTTHWFSAALSSAISILLNGFSCLPHSTWTANVCNHSAAKGSMFRVNIFSTACQIDGGNRCLISGVSWW